MVMSFTQYLYLSDLAQGNPVCIRFTMVFSRQSAPEHHPQVSSSEVDRKTATNSAALFQLPMFIWY